MSGFKFKEISSIDNIDDNINKDVKRELTLF
jgi:hypothetical protein